MNESRTHTQQEVQKLGCRKDWPDRYYKGYRLDSKQDQLQSTSHKAGEGLYFGGASDGAAPHWEDGEREVCGESRPSGGAHSAGDHLPPGLPLPGAETKVCRREFTGSQEEGEKRKRQRLRCPEIERQRQRQRDR
jgi:hypothetical protein